MNKATSLITAAVLLGLATVPAHALPFAAAQPSAPPATGIIQVQANCNAVGQQVAAEMGGRLSDVRAEDRGGRIVCVGEVIIPPRGDSRGEKKPFERPL